MKFIPILFSNPMVQAVLDGRKIITRRTKGLEYFNKVPDLFKITNKRIETCRLWDGAKEKCPNPIKTEYIINSSDGHENKVQCPYGQPGDILWVRESFCPGYFDNGKHGYKADWNKTAAEYVKEPKWKPSIHMPKEACRIFLKVKSVRVERLQNISEEDAKAEGIEIMKVYVHKVFRNYQDEAKTNGGYKGFVETAIESFRSLWQSINGEKSWKDNPWVWVVEFERVNLTESEKQFFFK